MCLGLVSPETLVLSCWKYILWETWLPSNELCNAQYDGCFFLKMEGACLGCGSPRALTKGHTHTHGGGCPGGLLGSSILKLWWSDRALDPIEQAQVLAAHTKQPNEQFVSPSKSIHHGGSSLPLAQNPKHECPNTSRCLLMSSSLSSAHQAPLVKKTRKKRLPAHTQPGRPTPRHGAYEPSSIRPRRTVKIPVCLVHGLDVG
jgi:hypothetical protein